jgi:hypothetical protein
MKTQPEACIGAEEIIDAINNGAEVIGETRDYVKLPWDILPSEYVQFAQKDAEGTDTHSIVNALSNAKRALECQIDSLMLALGLESIAKRLSVPKKLDLLNNLRVIAPRVLRKVNKHRNEMEHAYTCPDQEVVMDFVDVVSLFVEATKRHIQDRYCEWFVDIPEIRGVVVVRTEDGLIIAKDYKNGFAPKGIEIKPGSTYYMSLLGALNGAVSGD